MRALALLLSSLVWPLAAQSPDVAYLLDGVKAIAAPDTPGPLCVFGLRAFPVIAAPSDFDAMEPVVAAASYQDGRIVAFGNRRYFDEDMMKVADTSRALANALRWAAGEKAAPRVGVLDLPGLAARLKLLGLNAVDVALGDLEGPGAPDVAITTPPYDSGRGIAQLAAFAHRHGLVIGATGFGWEIIARDSDLVRHFSGNRLLGPAGIVWADGRLQVPADGVYTVSAPPQIIHARAAAQVAADGTALKDLKQVSRTITRAALNLPAGDTVLLPKLEALAKTAGVVVPSETDPVRVDQPLRRLAIALEQRKIRYATPHQVGAHPAAAIFPGSVPPDAGRVARDQVIDTAGKPGWWGTGLYAPPGEVITIRISPELTGKGLHVVVGVHNDTLWHLETWQRMPEISATSTLNQTETRIANAFGGAIYIAGRPLKDQTVFVVNIAGAVAAPRYVAGKTPIAEWRDIQRKLPAPWAEIESAKIALSVPSSAIRDFDSPDQLMEVWDRVVGLQDELAGWKTSPIAWRMVPDVDIAGGWLHAGYPIMMHMERVKVLLSRDLLLAGWEGPDKHGAWGLFHELGHNHQSDDWTFEGAVEVTNNLFALYVGEQMCNLPLASHPRGSPQYRAEQMARYDFARPDFEKWKSDMDLALVTYEQLLDAFGWAPFRNVFAEYRDLPAAERPKTDAEKRDQWLVRFSRQVHRNLGPFFTAWGIPTSGAARKSIAALPVWMPAEPPGVQK
ncbi:conserved exported hypothetical protein [Candidatus Sulfopaludibacter sp. SbA3]|nr:conserved exported hypothetical protein [Candidatus Sulfopaludibacter sp. SbA3]